MARTNGKVVEMKYSWRKGREGRDARLEMKLLLPSAGGWLLVAWFVVLLFGGWWCTGRAIMVGTEEDD